MDTALVATATFDSTHSDPGEGPHLHGHTFTVSVTEKATLEGLCPTLAADLLTVTRSLHLHTLTDMLYGGNQTLDGIGSWIVERLLLQHPRITRVEVTIPGMSGVVTREIR